MDFWLVLTGFALTVFFLIGYHQWTRENARASPFKIGRLVSMALALLCCLGANSLTTAPWLFYTISVLSLLAVLSLNIHEAGPLHGALMPLWQLLSYVFNDRSSRSMPKFYPK